MSLLQKISPVGIDVSIDKIQLELFNHLTNISSWIDYESYPRAYKNPMEENKIPEVAINEKDYQEVLFDDKFRVTSFFLTEDNASANTDGVFNQRVSIIFQAVLSDLYPLITTHRADAEMLSDIMSAFENTNYNAINIITGVDNVYSDLDLRNRLKEHINLTDMSQFHVLRIDFEVQYTYDCKYKEI